MKLAQPWLIAAIPALLAGCMTARQEASKDARTGISANEKVVVLESSYLAGNDTEDEFVECIATRIVAGQDSLALYPESELRDALFPWLEPRTEPRQAAELQALLAHTGIATRISERGIRYMVWISGDTRKTGGGGSMACGAGPGGGGCLGLTWWENNSAYEATVWDLQSGNNVGSVKASVNGTSVIPALIIPVPFISRTQNAACKSLALQIQQFITQPGSAY